MARMRPAQHAITWIHLSDFHAGQRKGKVVWSQIEKQFEASIRAMTKRLGRPDLILFTGDLAFAGEKAEYDTVDRLLDLIDGWVGAKLPVFAVPGNHDLARPKPAYKFAYLRNYETDESLRHDLWAGDEPPLHPLFARYSEWADRRVIAPLRGAGFRVHLSDRMPGDLCVVFEKHGIKLGLVGLNSSWVQYDGGEFERLLQLPLEQFQAALPPAENRLDWFDGLDAALLLTHHPRSWLTERAEKVFEEAIYPPGRFTAALYGHAHDTKSEVVGSSSKRTRAYYQAPSLFGLEHYGHEQQSRICGYAWGRLSAGGELRLWPLTGTPRGDNSYEFDRDTSFSPDDDDEWGGYSLVGARPDERRRTARDGSKKTKAKATRSKSGSVSDAELEHYFRKAASKLESLTLLGFPNTGLLLELEDLHVPLDAILDWGRRGRDIYASAQVASDAKIQDADQLREQVTLINAFAHRSKRRGIVLLGDPGSGKTTHLKQMLLQIKRHGPQSVGLPPGTVPVFLPLRELVDLQAGLPAFIQAQLRDPMLDVPEDFGARLCKRGKLLLLLDGLDEVADQHQRAEVARWIGQMLDARDDNYLLVSSRYAGYSEDVELPKFLELHLRPLDDDQVQAFVHNWYRLVEKQQAKDLDQAAIRAEHKANNLLAVLARSDVKAVSQIYAMTRNPLLLTAICLVHHDEGRLPRVRAELYEKSIGVLLARWKLRGGERLNVLGVLQPVAAWLHGRRERTASKSELRDTVTTALAKQRGVPLDADAFLDEIRNDCGLLTGWGVDIFGFMHLGFQEFLTAEHLQSDLDELASHFGDSWWQEVILLTLARPRAFERLMRALLRRPEFVVWSRSELMGLCLGETVELSSAPFMEMLATDEVGGELQLAVAELFERALPEEFEREAVRLREHPMIEVQEWVASRDRAAGERKFVQRIELVHIPAGSFLMGSPDDEEGRWDEEGPQQRVRLDAFYLARTPVTNAQYAQYMKANPEVAPPAFWGNRKYNQPQQPVVGVSWDEAQAFCAWAKLVLPTEAQWEYACRAETTTRYWSGDAKHDLARVDWYGDNSDERLHSVAELPANSFGLHDMHGNVREWCLDRWGNYETRARDGDGIRHEPVNDTYRVFRGGGFGFLARFARSAVRGGALPGFRAPDLGFRPAQRIS